MNNLVKKIREEIDRLQLSTMDEHMNYYSQEAQGAYNVLAELDAFIDSIVNPLDYEHATIINTDFALKDEEPKNKDFEDFVRSYMRANDDNILHYYDRYAGLIDGTQWQKEQMMKDAVEAYVNFYEEIPGNYYTEFVVENLRPRFGDKVKLIIIKEE